MSMSLCSKRVLDLKKKKKLEEFLEDLHAILEIKKAGLIVESIYLAQFLVFFVLCVS